MNTHLVKRSLFMVISRFHNLIILAQHLCILTCIVQPISPFTAKSKTVYPKKVSYHPVLHSVYFIRYLKTPTCVSNPLNKILSNLNPRFSPYVVAKQYPWDTPGHISPVLWWLVYVVLYQHSLTTVLHNQRNHHVQNNDWKINKRISI